MISGGEIARQETFTQASRRIFEVGENGAKMSVVQLLRGFAHDIVLYILRQKSILF